VCQGSNSPGTPIDKLQMNNLNQPSRLPPAAKTLFIKRVLDSQKFLIGKVWILFFLRVPSCTFVAKKQAVDLGQCKNRINQEEET
jgi:hypothetical protein